MDRKAGGCRLCLDAFAECFTTLENPELKKQMGSVFCFAIESKGHYSSSVCQSCSYTISEFYQFSEKVRQNQAILDGRAAEDAFPPMVTIESIKIEVSCDSDGPELAEKTDAPSKINPEEKEDPNYAIDGESREAPPPRKLRTKRKAPTPEPEPDASRSEASELSKQEKEYQLISTRFPMVCDICGAKADSFKLLRAHFWKEHKRRDAYVVCCNKKLLRRHIILDHIAYHANPDVFRCEVCGNKFKSKDSLQYHMAAHEGKGWSQVCEVCGREYKSKKGFQQHMNEQHCGMKVEKVQCHICQRWLKGRKNLRCHFKLVHGTNRRIVKCDLCPKKYTSLSSLKMHMKQIHSEAKHECEFCGKTFGLAVTLKEHRTVHTGEGTYFCEFCDMKTEFSTHMYNHVREMHPEEWAERELK